MFHEKEHISKEQAAYLRRTQKRKAAVWLLQVLLLILFFLLWEIAADCGCKHLQCAFGSLVCH